MMLLDVNFVFGGVVAVVVVLMMLAGVLRSERWTGEQREKQNRHKHSLHGADGSMRASQARRKSLARHQKMNGAGTRRAQPGRLAQR